jgi:hypothetical protein
MIAWGVFAEIGLDSGAAFSIRTTHAQSLSLLSLSGYVVLRRSAVVYSVLDSYLSRVSPTLTSIHPKFIAEGDLLISRLSQYSSFSFSFSF